MLLHLYILRTFAVAFTSFPIVALAANMLLTCAFRFGAYAEPFEYHGLEQNQQQEAAGIEHNTLL
jgi:hypothetical protein